MRFSAIAGRWLAAALLVLAAAGPASAQTAVAVAQVRNMNFGKFASDADFPGTVVMSPTADQTTLTGPLIDFGGTKRRARFKITGTPKAWVIITLPTSITITKGTSANTMTVDSFTMDVTNPVKLNNSGAKTFNVGATLHVSTLQKQGSYNTGNDFTVYVDYQ